MAILIGVMLWEKLGTGVTVADIVNAIKSTPGLTPSRSREEGRAGSMSVRKLSGLLGVAVAVAVVMLLCSGCRRERLRKQVDARELLIDASALPSGWGRFGGPISSRDLVYVLQDQDADDFAVMQFVYRGVDGRDRAMAVHDVWNFGTPSHAAEQFSNRFRPPDPTDECVFPGWSYHSEEADEFRFYCWSEQDPQSGQSDTVFTAIARYGQYLSALDIPVGARYNVGPRDIECLLRIVDGTAREVLGEAEDASGDALSITARVMPALRRAVR